MKNNNFLAGLMTALTLTQIGTTVSATELETGEVPLLIIEESADIESTLEDTPEGLLPDYDVSLLPNWFFLEGNDPHSPDVTQISPFEDIHEHWARGIIHTVSELGVFSDREENIFAPDEVMVKVEFVTAFARGLFPDSNFTAMPTDLWYDPFIRVLETELNTSLSEWRTDIYTPISASEASLLVELYEVEVNGYQFTNSSLDRNVWIKSNILTSEVIASNVITRAVGASIIHDILFPYIHIVSNQGLISSSYVELPTDSDSSETALIFSNAIISSRSEDENNQYRVITSEKDLLYAKAFSFLDVDPDFLKVRNFAISFEQTTFEAYYIGIFELEPLINESNISNASMLLMQIEKFLENKATSLYGYNEELLAIRDHAVLRYIDENTIGIIMAPNSYEKFDKISEEINGKYLG